MYNPHILECAVCLEPFVDGQKVVAWHEDYICMSCSPEFLTETNTRTWRAMPKTQFDQEIKSERIGS